MLNINIFSHYHSSDSTQNIFNTLENNAVVIKKSCMYNLHVVNLANFWIIYNLNVLQYFKKLEPTSEGCNNPAWCIVYAKLTSEIITFHVSEWRRNKFQKNPLSGIHWIFITCHDKNMSTCKWQDRQQDRYDDSNIPILVCRPGYISIIQRAMILYHHHKITYRYILVLSYYCQSNLPCTGVASYRNVWLFQQWDL